MDFLSGIDLGLTWYGVFFFAGYFAKTVAIGGECGTIACSRESTEGEFGFI